MNIQTKFSPTELVYLKTDPDQREYVIVAIQIYPKGMVTYTVGNNGFYTEVYEFELSKQKDVVKTTSE